MDTHYTGTIILDGGRIHVYPGLPRTAARRGVSMGYTIDWIKWASEASGPFGRDLRRWEHNQWRATYRMDGRSIQTTYRTGLGITELNGWDPLSGMFMDGVNLDAGQHNWARDLGMDPDERRTRTMFAACERQRERLERFFGSTERYEAWEKAVDLKERGE